MRRLAVLFCVGLITIDAYALDTTIRVLAVHTSDASTSGIATQMNTLKTAWDASAITAPIGLTLVNGGASSLLGGGALSGDVAAQWAMAQLPSRNLGTLRDTNAADIVIVFTSNFTGGDCGFGPQQTWTDAGTTSGAFVPDPIPSSPTFGLDLRAADAWFVAIVATGPSCQWSQLTAHEFGHLLGGGHELGSPTETVELTV